MKPAKLDLPIIWRGCDWGPVDMKWKDQDGNRINFVVDPETQTVWRPKAHSLNIDLNAFKLAGTENIGSTRMVLNRNQTLHLKVGVETWDWVWELVRGNPGSVIFRYPPFLSGKIQIKDPISAVTGEDPPNLATENGTVSGALEFEVSV